MAILIIAEWENHATVNQIKTPAIINGTVLRKLKFTELIVTGSCELKESKKKKSHVSPRKITGNMNNINTELVLFFHIWL